MSFGGEKKKKHSQTTAILKPTKQNLVSKNLREIGQKQEEM
jgi:hypothetical protein